MQLFEYFNFVSGGFLRFYLSKITLDSLHSQQLSLRIVIFSQHSGDFGSEQFLGFTLTFS